MLARVFAQDRENIVLDAFDVFCAHWPSVASRMRVAVAVAAVWGVDSSRLEHLIGQRKPNVAVADETWTVGRVALPTTCKHPAPLPAGFAPTRHGLCLLERLAAGVMMGEPMLLVGGTSSPGSLLGAALPQRGRLSIRV